MALSANESGILRQEPRETAVSEGVGFSSPCMMPVNGKKEEAQEVSMLNASEQKDTARKDMGGTQVSGVRPAKGSRTNTMGQLLLRGRPMESAEDVEEHKPWSRHFLFCTVRHCQKEQRYGPWTGNDGCYV